MDQNKFSEELVDYITEISNTKIQTDTDLIDQGIIDSFSILQIVNFIEERFNLEIDPEELPIQEFHRVETLVRWVQRLVDDKMCA